MELFNSTLYIKSIKTEEEVIEIFNQLMNCKFNFDNEDENKNRFWSCNSLGFCIEIINLGNEIFENWYSFILTPHLDLIPIDFEVVISLDSHFIKLFSNIDFEKVLKDEEFNEEFKYQKLF